MTDKIKKRIERVLRENVDLDVRRPNVGTITEPKDEVNSTKGWGVFLHDAKHNDREADAYKVVEILQRQFQYTQQDAVALVMRLHRGPIKMALIKGGMSQSEAEGEADIALRALFGHTEAHEGTPGYFAGKAEAFFADTVE